MNMDVSDEIRELFQYITRYKPQVYRVASWARQLIASSRMLS